jgi:hypothetical protein
MNRILAGDRGRAPELVEALYQDGANRQVIIYLLQELKDRLPTMSIPVYRQIAGALTRSWHGSAVPAGKWRVEVWDSPSSAEVVIDAIRCSKLASDRGLGGPIEAPSAYFMESPPVQHGDEEARRLLEVFVNGEEIPPAVSMGEDSDS